MREEAEVRISTKKNSGRSEAEVQIRGLRIASYVGFTNNNIKEVEMWICDDCQQPIEKPEDGFLEWEVIPFEEKQFHNFRIVHNMRGTPRRGIGCYSHRRTEGFDLDCYCGVSGLKLLLDLFKYATDGEELVEIIKRIHVPGYEASR